MKLPDARRWAQLSPALDELLELTPEAQAARLASWHLSDPALAAELELLLRAGRRADDDAFLTGHAGLPTHPLTLAGQRIGAYCLDAPIGQGGSGAVWRAHRADGQYEGSVAIKLLHLSWVGHATAERFRREGAILARLAHPNIARMLDAGVTPDHQPYLVLELIDGEAIDRHADSHRMSIEQRIALFMQVLDAVAHAHSHLVVHRDIKPANVLVTSGGTVKLLDFGIAKLLEGDVPLDAAPLTQEGTRALTLHYAAPEQLQGGTITTATDVYALGVMLYELLGGRHPTEPEHAGAAESIRATLETEPARLSQPSARIEQIAAARATSPAGLQRRLRGDLDNIVARALRKQPAERYGSVAALAEDLRRHLADEPISARADSLAYRAARFVRRNRKPVALAALAIAAMLAGLAGTITQAQRATRDAALAQEERQRADREARAANEQRDFALLQLSRAEAINDLNRFLLSDAAPSGKPFTVGDLLARAESIIERQHAETDVNRVEMLMAIGLQYHFLDEDTKALKLLQNAFDTSRELSEPSTRARAACAFANAISRSGGGERASRLIDDALTELPSQPQFTVDRIFCLLRSSAVARTVGKPQTGVERAEAAQQLLGQLRFPSKLLEMRVTMDVAEAYRMAGRYRDADASFRKTHALLIALGREDTDSAGTLLNNWALSLSLMGQPLKAEELFVRAIRLSSADSSGKGVSPMLLANMARTLEDLHRLPEAAAYAAQAETSARRAGDEPVIIQTLMGRASVHRKQGDLDRAAAVLAEVEPRLAKMYPAGHVTFASFASQQALLAQARGNLDSAMTFATQAIAIAERGGYAYFVPILLQRRSDLALQMRRFDEARADAARALQLEQSAGAPGMPSATLGSAHLTLARALRAQGRRDEAAAAYASALEHLRATLGPEHPKTREAQRPTG